MKKRNVIAWLLCAAMAAGMMTGCGNSASSSANSQEGSGEIADTKEVEKIVYATWTINTTPSTEAIQSVEDEINKITVDKIGVEVDYQVYPLAEYNQKIAMKMQSGEQIDAFCACQNYPSILSNEMAADITDLLEENCPEVMELIPEDWWECAKQDGRIYTIPTWLPSALYLNLCYRSDIAEELNLDMDSVKTVEDLSAVFETVHATYPDMYCLVGGNAGFGGWTAMTYSIPGVDSMGDNVLLPAGVLMPGSDTVVNLFETEEYAARMDLVRDWYEKGYIMQDLATTTLTNIEILSGGNAFANITGQGSYPETVAANASAQTGMPLASIMLGDPSINTSNITNQSWCVATGSKHAEAALKFINMTYYDADIANLISWGIEGRDYVVNEDGTCQPPEGMDSSSVPYPGGYMNYGNMYTGLEYPSVGMSKEGMEWGVSLNRDADRSIAFGFVFDSSKVVNQYAAVNNAIMQYYSGLDCGSVDPKTAIPEFVQALKDAGIDDIIAEKQAQYDAWKGSR